MIARWRAQLRAWAGQYNRVRPTPAGVAFLIVTVGVAIGAMNTGNNLLYAVLSALLATLIVNNVLAEWNLRGLRARRALPAELFAGQPARGQLVLENPRRVGAALGVRLDEQDGGRAHAELPEVAAGGEAAAPADWTFPARGEQRYATLRVGSAYPFGLLLRYRDLDLPGTVLVYPTPDRDTGTLGGPGDGATGPSTRGGVDETGELYGLRPYQPGDPVRRIHARSSARVGTPMVMLRAGESGRRAWARVDPAARGSAREAQIRSATGKVLRHAAEGDAIGLDADGVRTPAATGAQHRRALLTTLALLPP